LRSTRQVGRAASDCVRKGGGGGSGLPQDLGETEEVLINQKEKRRKPPARREMTTKAAEGAKNRVSDVTPRLETKKMTNELHTSCRREKKGGYAAGKIDIQPLGGGRKTKGEGGEGRRPRRRSLIKVDQKLLKGTRKRHHLKGSNRLTTRQSSRGKHPPRRNHRTSSKVRKDRKGKIWEKVAEEGLWKHRGGT